MKLNKVKLLGGFLIVVALMAVMVVVVYVNLQTIARASDRILFEEVPVAEHTMGLMVKARDEQQLFTDLSLTGDSDVRNEIKVVRSEFDTEVAALRALAEGNEIALLEPVAAAEEDFAANDFRPIYLDFLVDI